MRREDMVLFAVLAAGCVVVPVALGVALHWPVALIVLLVIALSVVLAFAARWQRFRRQQEELRAEQDAPARAVPDQPVDPGRRMAGVPLPCAEPGYRFLLAATVFWRPAPNPIGMRHTNPEALALESIRARACQVTAAQAPADSVAVEYQLAAALGNMAPDISGQVVAWALEVSVSIPDDDAARLRKMVELRKHEQVWEHERGLERTMRAYLRDEVLASPGSAVVWWLARHPEQVEATARLIEPLAQLSAAARGVPVSELFGLPEVTGVTDGTNPARG